MARSFIAVIPEQCAQHAQFMSQLTQAQAESIFWILFCIVIVMLMISAQCFADSASHAAKIQKATAGDTPLSPEQLAEYKLRHRRSQLHCIHISFVCTILSIGCTIVEAYAALNLMFCWRVDLVFIYWAFWTLIQVGSSIAIFGVTASQLWALGKREPLSWSVALGTPVLCLAALGFMAIELGADAVKWSLAIGDEDEGSGTSNLQPNNIADEESAIQTQGATLVAFTVDHRPLISYPSMPDVLHAGARLFGHTEDGRPMFVYEPISTTEVITPATSVRTETSASSSSSG